MQQRAAIYTRISKDSQGEGKGVERQQEDCLARAQREGWEIVEVYEDNDISASTRSKKARPAYDRMIQDVLDGRADVILAYSNSRLTRRPLELEDLIKLHERTKVRICTIVSGDDDLGTADGRQNARLRASIDAGEAERASERQLRAQRHRREAGESKVRRSFGWSKKGKPKAAEFEALREGLEAVLRGASTSSIARQWNEQGIKSVTDRPWTQRRIVEQLTRWRLAGVVEHLGEPVEGVTGKWEAVTDRATLERVRRILLDPNRRTMTPGRPPSSLLSSVAVCGRCGKKMVASKAISRSGKSRYLYRCSSALSTTGEKHYLGIERAALDKAALDAARLELALGNPAGLTPTDEERARLDDLRDERAEVTTEIGQIGEAMGRRELSPIAGIGAQRGLNERLTAIDSEITAIQDRYEFADVLIGSGLDGKKADYEAVAKVGEQLLAKPVPEQRKIIRALLTITVMPGRGDERIVIERRMPA